MSATSATTQKTTICDGWSPQAPSHGDAPLSPERGITFCAHRAEPDMVAIVPEREHVNFPILPDMDNSYAMSLNLAIWVGAELQEYMTGIGRMLPQCQGNGSWMLPIPATFVVGKGGRIKSCFV